MCVLLSIVFTALSSLAILSDTQRTYIVVNYYRDFPCVLANHPKTLREKALEKYLKRIYTHFFASLPRPAFPSSSGDITMWNSTSALNIKNHGSAILGTTEGSATSAIMITPRRP